MSRDELFYSSRAIDSLEIIDQNRTDRTDRRQAAC